MKDEGAMQPLSLSTFTSVVLKPGEVDWWASVPANAGWYAVRTDTPHSVFGQLQHPPAAKTKHYNLAGRYVASSYLRASGSVIAPREPGGIYVVYSGEAKDLKARAREHTHGNSGTACLALSNYAVLHSQHWEFLYLTCESHVNGSNGDKVLRTYLEQRWRGENGWPLLCTQ